MTRSQMTPNELRAAGGHLLVRRVIDRDNEISAAVFDIAAGDKRCWSLGEWAAVLADLKACRLTLADWLDLNT